MLVVRPVDLAGAIDVMGSPPLLQKWSQDGTLFAFVAEKSEVARGFAIAESHPRAVHVAAVDGDTEVCRLLLERMVEVAGERDVVVWCPLARTDLLKMLAGWGFVAGHEDDSQGPPHSLYCLSRNEDVEEDLTWKPRNTP
jgi:hypothetical protein